MTSPVFWAPLGTTAPDVQFAGYVRGPQSAVGVLTDVVEDLDPPTLRPVTMTLNVDLSPLREAFRRLGEQIIAMRPWIDHLTELLRPERPVDRARRLRLDRQLRTLARRADRRARIAARRR